MDLRKLLKNDKSALIIASRPLDLDCLGSGLILKKYLEHLGKKVRLFFSMGMTAEEKEFNSWLPYFNEVEDKDTREILSRKNFDALFLLDGANLIQFYDSSETKDNSPNLSIYDKRIHIDHHQKIESLGTHTLHNSQASATAEIILTEVVPEDFIDKNMATLGYAAVAGDTGNFRWNFSPSTLRLATMLLEKGADTLLFLDKYFFSKTKTYFEMLAFAIENVEYFEDLGTMFLFLPYEKLQASGIDESKLQKLKKTFDEGFSRLVEDYPRGVMLYEKFPGKIRCSTRGANLRNKISLPELLADVGGNSGGHFHAAGLQIEGNFEEVKKSLLAVLQRRLMES